MERKSVINVRVSSEELKNIKASADNVGMTVSDYVRSMAEGIRAVPYDPAVKDAIFELLSLLRDICSLIQVYGKDTSQGEYLKELNVKLFATMDAIKEYLNGLWEKSDMQ